MKLTSYSLTREAKRASPAAPYHGVKQKDRMGGPRATDRPAAIHADRCLGPL